MDSYDIFKRLTTNLSFCKENNVELDKKDETKTILKNYINKDNNNNDNNNNNKRKLNDNNNVGDGDIDDDNSSIKIIGDLTLNKINKKQKLNNDLKISKINEENINHTRNVYNIYVNGVDIPAPIDDFNKLFQIYKNQIPKLLIDNLIDNYKFIEPTPIQMQAIPVMLNNRELIACAPTGSGKTISFLLPILSNLKKPDNKGFRALILAPTRELVRQTYLECCRLSKGMGFRVYTINNATKAINLFNSSNSSKKYDILITTPNRLVFMINQNESKLDLNSVEWLVIDEADKLFEDGKRSFREQLAIIYKSCSNPYIKHAMFSATYTNEIENWCKLQLNNAIQVSIGRKNVAVFSVSQEIIYVGNENGKLFTLRSLMKKGFEPPILIFVQSKERAKELFKELIYDSINVDVIHSERTQQQRDNTIRAFRQGKIWVLICTELMGRGIDFKGVNLVINYDFPLTSISYIHRIGRTGRAGKLGHAITFFTDDDLPYLKSIANVMREAGCEIPDYMLDVKKPNKKLRRKLSNRAPKRARISRELKFKKKKIDISSENDKQDSSDTTSNSIIENNSKLNLKHKDKVVKSKEKAGKKKKVVKKTIK